MKSFWLGREIRALYILVSQNIFINYVAHSAVIFGKSQMFAQNFNKYIVNDIYVMKYLISMIK